MNVSRRLAMPSVIYCAAVLTGLFLVTANPLVAEQPGAPESAGQLGRDCSRPEFVCKPSAMGSPFIPVDSWVYPAMLRLYSLGYVDTVYLGLRPWTRASVKLMLEEAGDLIGDSEADGDPGAGQAREIYDAINREMQDDMEGSCGPHQGSMRIESVYTVARAISGTPLHDSFHLGSTIVNDYGRPFENGFNNYSGASGYATAGRFTLYVRGEFQGAPSAAGYSAALAQTLSTIDETTFLNPITGLPYSQT